jgi:MAF protein
LLSGHRVCLVSASPRRRALLGLLGIPMTVLAAHGVDETPRPGETPEALVRRLSRAKALAVVREVHDLPVIVAADTVVAFEGEILGKPYSLAEADAVLRRLRDRVHEVYTGVTVVEPGGRRLITDCCVTDVPMRAYGDEEIDAYLATGDPLDKAGSYAIQHAGFHPAAELSGCYANVMGLPLCHLTRMLRRLSIMPRTDLPDACRKCTGYACPVADQILSAEAPAPEAYDPETK